jgi:hypothetical protein
VISKVDILSALSALSRKRVLLLRSSAGVVRSLSAAIVNPSESGFWLQYNVLATEHISLEGEGFSFDIASPIFCLSPEERRVMSDPSSLDVGVLIGFPSGERLYISEMPSGRNAV